MRPMRVLARTLRKPLNTYGIRWVLLEIPLTFLCPLWVREMAWRIVLGYRSQPVTNGKTFNNKTVMCEYDTAMHLLVDFYFREGVVAWASFCNGILDGVVYFRARCEAKPHNRLRPTVLALNSMGGRAMSHLRKVIGEYSNDRTGCGAARDEYPQDKEQCPLMKSKLQ